MRWPATSTGLCSWALGRTARVLPARDPERLPGASADAEKRRSGLLGDCAAAHRWIPHEDERPGRCVERLAVDGERRATRDDDVELLLAAVPVRLVVVLDDD